MDFVRGFVTSIVRCDDFSGASSHSFLHENMSNVQKTTGITIDFIWPNFQSNTGCFPIQDRPVFSQFRRFFPQPEDFIGIYYKIQKAQAVSLKRQ